MQCTADLTVWLHCTAGSSSTLPKLAKMGFPADGFSGAVTSGDITFQNLKLRPDGWWQSLGRRCLHITWGERGPVSVEGLNLEVNATQMGISTKLCTATARGGSPWAYRSKGVKLFPRR